MNKHLRELQTISKRLDLGQTSSLENIKQHLEQSRHSSIEVTELKTLAGSSVCGLWLAYEGRDVVVHAPVQSAWHRQQIILHEFAHMILGHDKTATPLTDLTMFGLSSTPRTALGRGSFDNADEADAEHLADLLAQRIAARRAPEADGPTGFTKVFG